MPPRRSCFVLVLHDEISPACCFNATTAFLLPDWFAFCCHLSHSFNATTAFLLHYIREISNHFLQGFQCHHGVPASR